ncbi:GMC oxidoreductase [Phenylobacterium montanum]|uniref:GMC family oxidoreductase n=1 Tax=Phenylobacterium montanum TaxID=2823693 RepID=A0A975IT45_9CAUL|nr:GMC family oxidoreductase [Caulobacter sp. S6]QUD86477.1 GMC family oxidoreductase [Caulobacter sp. S6]
MIAEFTAAAGSSLEFDICIVGGGAAGLTLAASLIDSGLSVVVLEAGGRKPDAKGLDAYKGEVADAKAHPFLHHFRVRAIGGASRIWGGRCIPYDDADLAERPWVPGPGWPIGWQALEPYYIAAQEAAEAGPFDYDPATALPGRPAEFAPGLDGALVRTTLERFSKPTDFWKRYGAALTAAANVLVLLHAAVTGVRLRPDAASVDHIEVAAADGGRAKVRARRYVIAMGGLETTRLLLASSDVRPAGIGNDHDHLGRYYMSHLAATSGVVTFNGDPARINYDYEKDASGAYVRRRLWLTEKAQREIRGLNVIFRTHLPDPADPAHGDPILSAMYLVKDLVLYEYSRKMREAGPGWGGRLRHLGNILAHPIRLARFAVNWVRDRNLAERKMPSVVLGSPQNRYPIEFHAEQSPNPDSRLTLTGDRDAYGMPRLRVDWRVNAADLEALKRAYAVLAAELERTGVGRLDYSPDEVAERALAEGAYGGHHLGTTRMSARPEDGVVDPDLRVHGVNNLFVASGSVLPTSSQANPTLTILALSLRLGDRLRADLAA